MQKSTSRIVFGLALASAAIAVGCTKHQGSPETPAAAVPAAPAATKAEPAVAVEPVIWRVVEAKGKVTVQGKPAATGAALAEGDEVVTGPKSSARLTVGPGSMLELRELSRIKLGSSPRHKISVQLLLGRLWSFFEAETDYEVVTANAVAGVRGTVFFADATAKEETLFCACRGKTHFTLPAEAAGQAAFDKEVDGHEWEHRAVTFTRKGANVEAKAYELGKYPTGKNIPKTPTHSNQQAEEILKLIHAEK